MKLSTVIGLGVAASSLLLAVSQLRRKRRLIEITSAHLGYQEHSPEELAGENLLDLNSADHSEFLQLGLGGNTSDRITENRPYRSKLDLLCRMIIPEHTYSAIRDRVGVARATEPVKIAGLPEEAFKIVSILDVRK
jgi:DNA uptake protein ComE-like DNA-binding protein